ncbi:MULTISPECIES: hypothetical protein [Rhodococcus]|uniref:Uncharacterized protein n=1 Tax=Rhodococcus jostii (strain RHA1) TaxID=101510 RepID=Q0RWR0_RHOJR|nr:MULTISPECIES: hypothetical protein [Rhodococcus]ABH00276.1 conserved hypothetical protein [Rhodococcus jostii RHA1]
MILDSASTLSGQAKLAELDIDVSTIHEVLLYGDAERMTYTALDANGAGEMARWSRHVRRLSEMLIPKGWTRVDYWNQPTLVHPSGSRCLIVTSGDGFTGTDYGVPSTKNPKGRTVRDAVEKNAQFALMSRDEVDPAFASFRETWMLLTNAHPDGQLYAEVSQPIDMEGDQISKWSYRLLISPIDPSASPEEQGNDDTGADYDFSVTRKV